MPEEKKPVQIIQELFEQRKTWTDEQVLAELKSLPVLPDEDDPAWDDDQTWSLIDLFLALADTAAARKLRAALPLLFERACYGDPGETMRGLRHQLEKIVEPEWGILTEACIQAATFPQPGARLWAIDELRRLHDKRSLQTLINGLQDQKLMIREEACNSLESLCRTNSDCRELAIEALEKYVAEQSTENEKRGGLESIENIRSL